MSVVHRLLTEHIDVWTAADTEKKSGRGRTSKSSGSVYGIKKLRDLILDLAVHGKLITQDESDEPAVELFKRIQAKKTTLISDGVIKKDKPLSPITENDAIFDIPERWHWVRLGDVCSYIQRGKSPTYTDSSEFPVISQKCVRWNGLDLSQARFIDPNSISKYEEIRLLRSGDILWNSTGTGTIGRACLVQLTDLKQVLVADSHVTVVRPIILSNEYLWRWIQSPTVQTRIEAVASGTTNQIELNTSAVIGHLCPLPPLAEQHRIVAKVDELMALCDQLEAQHTDAAVAHEKLVSHLLSTLTQSQNAEDFSSNWQRIAAHFNTLFTTEASIDALKKTLLQLAVMGKLVPQDPRDEPARKLLRRIETEKAKIIAGNKKNRQLPPIKIEDQPFELPLGWAWARFPELGEFGRGKSKHRPRNDPKLFNPGVYPLVQTGEVARADDVIDEYHSKYSDLGLAQSKIWPAGTLCITIAANIADSALLGFSACFPDSVVGFVPCQPINDSKYFLTFMKTARENLLKFAPATAQKNINLEILESVLIPIPPLKEISRIVAKVDELTALCDQLKSRITDANQLQQKLANVMVEQAVA